MNEFKVSFAVFFVFLLLVFQGNADNTECLNKYVHIFELICLFGFFRPNW